MNLWSAGEWQTAELSGDFSPQYPNYQWEVLVSEWDELDMMQIQSARELGIARLAA